jgi:haloacetate dehalogenase
MSESSRAKELESLWIRRLARRELLLESAALAAGAAAFRPARAAAQTGDGTLRFFPGFKSFKVETTGATINGVIGGQGPPILLLHGAPQTHLSWRLVAPKLAEQYTVVASDLRGYGDSSKPADGENHANYSKRAMALDQVEVMKHFGFDRFPVIGHDRGGGSRTAWRSIIATA